MNSLKTKNNSIYIILYVLLIISNYINQSININLNLFISLQLGITYFIFGSLYIKKSNKFDNYFIFYSVYLIFLLIYGIIVNNYTSFILADILSFFSFLIIVISSTFKSKTEFYTVILPTLGVYINIISFIFVFIYIAQNGLSVASMTEGRNIEIISGVAMSPKYLLFNSLFLYPLVFYTKVRWHRLIYHISIIMFILLSLAMASRGTLIIGIVVLLLSLFNNRTKRISFINIFVSLVIVFVLFWALYQIPKVRSATDFTITRFDNSLTSSRSEEANEIFNSLTPIERIFGKGLGASNKTWIFIDTPYGVNNAHFGWIYLILKGGVLFLVFIYSKIILSCIKLFRHKYLRAYAIVLLAFLLLEISHTSFNSFYKLNLMFLSISASSVLNRNYRK
jgi:hypothetical protein